MVRVSLRAAAVLGATAVVLAVSPSVAGAATFTPNTLADEFGTGGDCSLREAVEAANTDGSFDACTATDDEDDTILLQSNSTYALTIPGVEDSNAAGDLDVLSFDFPGDKEGLGLSVMGGGMAAIDGNGAATGDRVLDLASGPTNDGLAFNASRLILKNGAGTLGGNVRLGSFANATFSESRIEDNVVPATRGGGIEQGNVLTLIDSTIRGNDSLAGGGGGIAHQGALTTIVRSTISANTTDGRGAGIQSAGETVITNSTISGNRADEGGGGIEDTPTGSVTLQNATVAANTADFDDNDPNDDDNGGGILGEATLQNTILAQNIDASTGGVIEPDCSGTLTSTGFNLIQSLAGCGLTLNNDLTGINPALPALDDNGGLTETHALPAGSPAVDAGGPAGPATDQRGIARPQAGRCDIGAFELEAASDAPSCAGFPAPSVPPLSVTPVTPLTSTTPGGKKKCKKKKKRLASVAKKRCKKRKR
jgi:CSLREA domain-containing protein